MYRTLRYLSPLAWRPGLRWLAALGAALVCLWLGSRAGDALVVEASLPTPDAVVSLGSHEWERLPELVRQAKRHPTAAVLLTEPLTRNWYNCYRCETRAATLARAGVAPKRIVLLPRKVTRTFDEAEAVREWMTRAGRRSVLVVTSPYHTRRALATFRRVLRGTGIQVGVQPSRRESPAQPSTWWRATYDRGYVKYEWSAILFYLVRFGIWPWPASR